MDKQEKAAWLELAQREYEDGWEIPMWYCLFRWASGYTFLSHYD